ncbi:hypothetical protein [Vibrio diabolicus]|uniref:hypothetical protein n=1 Tax=Vibrio diabolicus TaxID=50719 RepID=UPI002481046B|nr:hypothetical protein [Vibrio diabolicus]
MSRKQKSKIIRKQIEQRDSALQELHAELFPEEYDFIYDSNVDAKQRARGENPMSKQYQIDTNQRRFKLGVLPYGGSVGIESTEGLITSWQYCQNKLNSAR